MFHSRHHPAPEWEVHRAEIRRLYIEEDCTLRQVMIIMGQKGFTATTKMYKTKLKQWKLFKNNRAADVAAILRSQSQRTAVGKESIAVRNGRRIDTQTYLKRKGVSADDLLQLAAAFSSHPSSADLPGHLRCITPPPPDPMTGVVFGSSAGRLRIKEVVGRWVLTECDRLGDAMMSTGMVIDSGIECEPPEPAGKERPLLVYYKSAANKIANHTGLGSRERRVLAAAQAARRLRASAISYTQPPDDYPRTPAGQHGPDTPHAVELPVLQLTSLFGEPEEDKDDKDEKYGLLHSIVLDAMSTLRSKVDEDEQPGSQYQTSSRQTYYDLVSLWYAESLRSYRGRDHNHRHSSRQGSRPQLHDLDEEDLLAVLEDSASGLHEEEDGQGGCHHQHDEDADLAGLRAIQSYLLLDLGHQTSWLDPSIYTHSVALLNWKTHQQATAPDETEVNCLTAMALYHRAQCGGESSLGLTMDPDATGHSDTRRHHHDLARHFLQEAVWLDWELSGASIYNFEGLLLLQEWCVEAEDWVGLEVVRRRSETCLSIMFEEWGV
ncbi:hypothetical protein BKA67DRAFT_532978 [Truncatella angustata]|uniref:Clr5 domain-containing protein n=1 Tax=Truncatella angustata TaxID=152316 RepID=A0A9P8UTI0_9PEZI|nr:uncharacterized protein BKA67DRAFT_532978 [Truncatella angustata]KAH6657787.1 hypothetical protein BKA67DRAFT_532978 [Truncatella angustata]